MSVGQLFIAGILPGILLTLLFSAYVAVSYPDAGRNANVEHVSKAEKHRLLRHLVPPAVIFAIVMGSIYGGLATPTESAALGVIAAFYFVWKGGRLSWHLLENCFIQSARTSGMVILVIVCALLLNVTLSMTGGTQAVTRWVTANQLLIDVCGIEPRNAERRWQLLKNWLSGLYPDEFRVEVNQEVLVKGRSF